MTYKDGFQQQLLEIHEEFLKLKRRSKYDDISDIPEFETNRFIIRGRAVIERICDKNSVYARHTEEIVRRGGFPGYLANQLFAVIDSLKIDIAAGYFQKQVELIHGELFDDFMEMAQHLLDEGFKDASAVIAGSSLESHLRQLAKKNNILIEELYNSKLVPRKADRINTDLYKNHVYTLLDFKSITAWLSLRNDAAHGHYSEYDNSQVGLMLDGIRNFISRIPA